ncbi:DUF1697 domain-containing protein [Frigidibacter sp. RF13]|uniref:DUF1697 domain-containing protein n=1 Tax=Frigidibacter sp. RF13 TaxID=2997340 RepID=UPI00226EDFD7|nr:DUF1697 domain-containing protein [Frigidibacter sp. RF13]MCY1127035.1 DUF1697 domain-containing protein [Frigidibacter sp. RF13]
MTVWIALLRAVNVSGVNTLPMEPFRALLDELRLEGARTYIQSGNAVFRSAQSAGALQALIADGVLKRFGFRPPVLMRTLAEMEAAHRGCPFTVEAGEKVFFHFMERELPRATGDFLKSLATAEERYAFQGRMLWLHLPGGAGRSKLADRVGRLPIDMTARNLKTVEALIALARKLEAA